MTSNKSCAPCAAAARKRGLAGRAAGIARDRGKAFSRWCTEVRAGLEQNDMDYDDYQESFFRSQFDAGHSPRDTVLRMALENSGKGRASGGASGRAPKSGRKRRRGHAAGEMTQWSGYGAPPADRFPTFPIMSLPKEEAIYGRGAQHEITAAVQESRRDLEIARTAHKRIDAFNAYITAERNFGIASYLAGTRKAYRELLEKQAARLAQVHHALAARLG